MKLNQASFDKIKSGLKTIEVRLNDEKRQLLKIGDEIEFSSTENLNEKIRVKVLDLYHFKSFFDLFNAFYPQDFGKNDKEDFIKSLEHYSKSDEEKYGVLGVKVEVI